MYRNPGGYSQVIDGWGVVTKEDTYTCKHCQKVCFVTHGTDPNEFWCVSCMSPICKRCKLEDWNRSPGQPCSHFERRLAEAEARGELLRRCLG